jgi:glycosyltransferase involved in cell wall biosynthesis
MNRGEWVNSHSESGGSRLRVLFFDHVATLSGAEIALLNLILHLDLNLIDPVVVLGEEGALADRLRSVAEVHILPMRADIRQARKDDLGTRSVFSPAALGEVMRYVRELAQFMGRRHIDLLHTNSLKSDLLGSLAAKLTRTPLIWHVRDRITADYLPLTVARTFRLLSRCLPDLIIADSHAVAATLSRRPSKRIHVVHEGTPHDEFARHSQTDASGRSGDTQIVGLVGRISPWKGQDIFLRAAGIVRRKYPAARFRIIGAALFDESEFEQKLHQLAADLDLGDALTFTGFRNDIHQAIAELDVLVHASTRPEPFGQVIIEGMAAAKPVIATNAGGVPEIVEDGVTGFLVPMSDPERMAEAIDRLLADTNMARAMGLRGQAHVTANFSIEKTVRGVLAAYHQVARVPMRSASLRQAADVVNGRCD